MSDTYVVEVGDKGRVVLPAPLRRELGIERGTELVALVEGDGLVFLTRDAVAARLHAMFADVPTSMADELIAERHAEAERENASD